MLLSYYIPKLFYIKDIPLDQLNEIFQLILNNINEIYKLWKSKKISKYYNVYINNHLFIFYLF